MDQQPRRRRPDPVGSGFANPAFLLAQVGAHAATRFAQRLAAHGLTPPSAGILRLVRAEPGLSQQALATRLDLFPSRVVALVDELEATGLLRRERSTEDRRHNVLSLTSRGLATLRSIGTVARAHSDDLLAALDAGERAVLADLLDRVADQQGLTPGVHPGYRQLGPA